MFSAREGFLQGLPQCLLRCCGELRILLEVFCVVLPGFELARVCRSGLSRALDCVLGRLLSQGLLCPSYHVLGNDGLGFLE